VKAPRLGVYRLEVLEAAAKAAPKAAPFRHFNGFGCGRERGWRPLLDAGLVESATVAVAMPLPGYDPASGRTYRRRVRGFRITTAGLTALAAARLYMAATGKKSAPCILVDP
jgi:hypothetical protein